jgi:hypothetical protein
MWILSGIFKVAGVVLTLCVWGLIPDLLWEYGYKFPALMTFLIIPIVLFELVHRYNEWKGLARPNAKERRA